MINYLIGFLIFISIVNFIVLLTLCSFIVSLADVISQIRNYTTNDQFYIKKENKISEDKGLIDV